MEQDYFNGPYFVMFPAGTTKVMFSIVLINDDVLEEAETFNVIVNSSILPSNVTIGELGDATVIIWDNDGESCVCLYEQVAVPLLNFLSCSNFLTPTISRSIWCVQFFFCSHHSEFQSTTIQLC